MPEKTITAWLVIDWKNEKTRTRKSEPKASDLGTNELKAEIEIDVTVPEVDVPTLALEIDVPEPRVYAATLEALDEEDLPDWADVANDVLDRERDAIVAAEDADIGRLVDSIVTPTLIKAPGRPDPEAVQEYVNSMVAELRAEAEPEGVPTDA